MDQEIKCEESSLLIISLFSGSIHSQEKPRTAVIPFNAVGVSETESVTASSLFETALVQTDAFLVIEQNQMKEILEAQAFTLSGCTDESCAVEIGKLLAAEQIVLGSFSSLGSGYILNAKIIDVTLGQNIKAEKVSFASLDELSDSADLLAYKLAGLKQGEQETSSAYGDELRKEAYEQFQEQIEQLEKDSNSLADEEVSGFPILVEDLLKQMIDSKYTFADLEARADVLLFQSRSNKEDYERSVQIKSLTEELTYWELKYKKEEKAVKRRNIFKYVFGGLAIGSLGTSGVTWYLGNEAYTNYENAAFTSEAIDYRDESQMYDIIKLSAGGAGITFTALTLFNLFKKDKRPEFGQKIEVLSKQISELEAE